MRETTHTFRVQHLSVRPTASLLWILLIAWLYLPGVTLGADASLIRQVQQGGYILYFRHAQTEWSQSDQYTEATGPEQWSSCDPDIMRQLSEEGRETSRQIGAQIRRLKIPVSAVYASEYCRSADTAREMGLGPVQTTRDILNARAARYIGGTDALKKTILTRFSTPPPANTNTVLVAHGNVIVLAGGDRPVEGGAAVIKPLGNNDFEVAGYINPEDWKQY